MTYEGRATGIKLKTKINGTHQLTFQMPDKFFDSKVGDYIRNEYVDELFDERKLKLKYKKKWYEFYIKEVNESKKFKSYIKTYTCQDAFIDELSRNGYGITFDTELYNNVEELGTFTEEILEDSVWYYEPMNNWGDFTEYKEEKLFKIPIEIFGGKISGYKLHFETNKDGQIENVFTKEKRNILLSDDAAADYFWDQQDNDYMALFKERIDDIPNNGYIYVPYSCLDFCYTNSNGIFPDDNYFNSIQLQATEDAQNYWYKDEKGISQYKNGYAIAPNSINPNHLIQFMAFSDNTELEIDEAGLILNTDHHYIITIEQWNELVKENYWYIFEDKRLVQVYNNGKDVGQISHTFKYLANSPSREKQPYGNKYVYYDGYLSNWGHTEVLYGKKISITDRTENNINEEIDQFTTVYRNKSQEFLGLYSNEEWIENLENYRISSKIETRQIVPQLARNLIQNGTNIKSVDGWEIQTLDNESLSHSSASIDIGFVKKDNIIKKSFLYYTPQRTSSGYATGQTKENTVLNFGIVGQEKKIEKEKIYCLGISLRSNEIQSGKEAQPQIFIGEGSIESTGVYSLNNEISFQVLDIIKIPSGQDYKYLAGATISKEITDENFEFRSGYILFKSDKTIENPYIGIFMLGDYAIEKVELFEAYTKGIDEFDVKYYRYSGRDLIKQDFNNMKWKNEKDYSYIGPFSEDEIRERILFEDDVMKGSSYEYQKYYIQRLHLKDNSNNFDTFRAKSYLSTNIYDSLQLPLDESIYSEDDYEIQTNYIDLNSCQYYKNNNDLNSFDCSYSTGGNNAEQICYYQRYGYCPRRFQAEKHCRKIRTLNGEKSNRFNLTQELSKVFEVYPIYYTNQDEMGRIVKKQKDGIEIMDKRVFYITEKGKENQLGFRYEQNLSDISRKIASNEIVTKLYVEDVDSNISKTGLSSIKTAEDNPSKDSFIIDFSYYTTKGILDKESVEKDLYGIENSELQGYLKRLGYLNSEYDRISNNIISLQNFSYTELEANLNINLKGIETSQQQLRKYQKQMNKYYDENSLEQSATYQNYLQKYSEQEIILRELVSDTYFTNSKCIDGFVDVITWFNESFPTYDQKKWTEEHEYKWGILGQFNEEYLQIQKWKKERASYLKMINQLSLSFFQKYEPYLKEGTWSDGNYLTDNAYYFGALEVSREGAIPKVSYTIKVIDISTQPEYEEYEMDIADTSYIEDIGMFGINPVTGLPNKLKVIISELDNDLDNPTNDSINVQNFTTQFEDLFQQVTASIQSLQFNENIYKRSSNFTSNQNVKEESLQGTLDNNDLTLLNTQENNISLDSTGQSGSDINNHANKYKLDGQGLFFSNNGGQSWNVGVGPSGINADYIKTGTLDAGKIRIVDNNYLYFLWDKNGIIAYRNPQDSNSTNPLMDYSLFNKYGLSIVDQGQIRLRAGYDFNATSGKMSDEQSQGTNIGFYLYNKDGDTIFRTETDEGNNETARLSLRGEMFVTDSKLHGTAASEFYYIYDPVKLTEKEMPYYEIENNVPSELSQMNSSGSAGQCLYRKEDGKTYYSDNYLQKKEYNGVSYAYSPSDDPIVYYTIKETNRLAHLLEGDLHPDQITLYETNTQNSSDFLIQTFDIYNQVTGYPELFSGFYYGDNDSKIQKTDYRYWRYHKQIDSTYNDDENTSIGLFINNKLIQKTPEGTSELRDKRILSCLFKDSNTYQNILTILKNGTLAIGGQIQENPDRIANMPDIITLNDPQIKLSKGADGKYKISMDFNNFLNNDGTNLATSISGTTASVDEVRQQIKNLARNTYYLFETIGAIPTPVDWNSLYLQSPVWEGQW